MSMVTFQMQFIKSQICSCPTTKTVSLCCLPFIQGASEVGLQFYASCIKVISIGFRVALFKENTVALLEKQ